MTEIEKDLLQLAYQAILIGLLSFIFPIWICTGINWGAILLKLYQCISLDLPIWDNEVLLFVSTVVSFVPLVYIFWFYYLTIQRILQKIYSNYLVHWNRELSNFLSTALIEWYDQSGGKSEGEELMIATGSIMDNLLVWINKRLENWPGIIRWATKKLLKQVPFLDIVLGYHDGDIPFNDHPKLVNEISEKLNQIMQDIISEIVPPWTYWVVPVNLFLLVALYGA